MMQALKDYSALYNSAEGSKQNLAVNKSLGSGNPSILHGFFEGLCFLMYDNMVYLVDDKMQIMYVQQIMGLRYQKFYSKLEFDGQNYLFATELPKAHDDGVVCINQVRFSTKGIEIVQITNYQCQRVQSCLASDGRGNLTFSAIPVQ